METNNHLLLFQSAFKLSIAVLAININHELVHRDKSRTGEQFVLDDRLYRHLCRQLDQVLGRVFIEKISTDACERMEKRQPSQTKLMPGMLAASSKTLSYTFEEIEIATTYGYEIAYEILQALKALPAYQSDNRFLETLINPQKILIEDPLFKDKIIAPIPSSFPVLSGLEAQIRKDLWGQDSNRIARYRKEAKRNPANFIEHYIANPGDITLLPWEEAQQIIDKFGFNTAKLHLIFAAHCMKQDSPWENRFFLSASNILKDLGWDKRNNSPKSKLLKEVASTAFMLSCLLVKTTWVEGKNREGKVQASCPVGRMWDLVVEPQGQLNTQGIIEEPTEVIIGVRPGGWTEHFLNKAGAKAKEALYQFSWLSEQVLKIDPYHEELALRLALNLTIENRYHKSGYYKIETLLKKILPVSEINAISNDRRRRYDLKQQWDNALELLISLGWKIVYDAQTYPIWLQPGRKERKPTGYIDKFLQAKISILQPTQLNSRTQAIAPRQTLPTPDTLTGYQLREVREAKGWSQRKLAELLGVSQSLIAQVEQGSRDIQPKMVTKLRKLISGIDSS